MEYYGIMVSYVGVVMRKLHGWKQGSAQVWKVASVGIRNWAWASTKLCYVISLYMQTVLAAPMDPIVNTITVLLISSIMKWLLQFPATSLEPPLAAFSIFRPPLGWVDPNSTESARARPVACLSFILNF